MSGYRHGYLAFGCGSKGDVVLFPFSDFQKVKEILNTTENENRMYWHVQIHMTDEGLVLGPKKGHEEVSLVRYLVSGKAT